MQSRQFNATGLRLALALSLAIAGVTPPDPVGAIERLQGPLPANASQPPGASFEGYPAVGRAQRRAIAQEVICSSSAELFRAPARSAAQVAGRSTERLAVCGRQALPGNITARLGLPGG